MHTYVCVDVCVCYCNVLQVKVKAGVKRRRREREEERERSEQKAKQWVQQKRKEKLKEETVSVIAMYAYFNHYVNKCTYIHASTQCVCGVNIAGSVLCVCLSIIMVLSSP